MGETVQQSFDLALRARSIFPPYEGHKQGCGGPSSLCRHAIGGNAAVGGNCSSSEPIEREESCISSSSDMTTDSIPSGLTVPQYSEFGGFLESDDFAENENAKSRATANNVSLVNLIEDETDAMPAGGPAAPRAGAGDSGTGSRAGGGASSVTESEVGGRPQCSCSAKGTNRVVIGRHGDVVCETTRGACALHPNNAPQFSGGSVVINGGRMVVTGVDGSVVQVSSSGVSIGALGTHTTTAAARAAKTAAKSAAAAANGNSSGKSSTAKKPREVITVREGLVTEADMQTVGDLIPKDWPRVCRYLGLTDAEIDAVRIDYRDYGSAEMAYRALSRWRQRVGPAATVKALAETLIKVKLYDVARKLSVKS